MSDPRTTLPARGLRAYEYWRKEVIASTSVLIEQRFEGLNMEDLEDFAEMVNTLMSFAPVIPEHVIAAREAFEHGVREAPRA